MCTNTPNDWISASGISVIIAVIGFALLQWRSNDWNRKNQLFDKRYKFYQQLREWRLSTQDSEHRYTPDIEDLIPRAEEAGFLFGDDIENHILSLAGKTHKGSPDFPNDDFSSQFRNYLKLR
jgi:hypothetical protein